jgi:hypothetical protein
MRTADKSLTHGATELRHISLADIKTPLQNRDVAEQTKLDRKEL